MTSLSRSNPNSSDNLAARLRVLTPAQVLRIDELIDGLGDFGEVHLVVQKKQLRYINQVQSYKVDYEGSPKK